MKLMSRLTIAKGTDKHNLENVNNVTRDDLNNTAHNFYLLVDGVVSHRLMEIEHPKPQKINEMHTRIMVLLPELAWCALCKNHKIVKDSHELEDPLACGQSRPKELIVYSTAYVGEAEQQISFINLQNKINANMEPKIKKIDKNNEQGR